MTPDAFNTWLADIKSAGLARSKAEAARLLGVHVNTITKRLEQGADRETALACRAILHRLEPYG